MKQITLDWDTYQDELNKHYYEGIEQCKQDILTAVAIGAYETEDFEESNFEAFMEIVIKNREEIRQFINEKKRELEEE